MSKISYVLRTLATIGSKPQTFIGAGWLVAGLRLCPPRWKRAAALRILALSPHYFYRHAGAGYDRLSSSEFLEAEFVRNRDSRQRIADALLQSYLRKEDVILDYGCGPGFLAKATAASVARVYACDISQGVIECARTVNPAANVVYLDAARGELAQVGNAALDRVYSIAVIQHVDDAGLAHIAGECFRMLKPGGRLVWQVQLESPNWRSEAEWRADHSLEGQLKLRYALHCFSRTSEFFQAEMARHGFGDISIEPIANIVEEHFDDVCHQHMLTARRL